ncbi:PDZ and LIM domain protein Zasp [Caerostris extrusa]|uniref:PDZ and LIM domain protein Zasp n=1 Tax=Caerostris extrusa TaxID=172846 RepID=A0AAV4WR07_CAEEX|nr:PDZ and LIM domain protein Zasp [Caerostris extrusa]
METFSMNVIAQTLSQHSEMLAPGVMGINFMKPEKPINTMSEVYKLVQEEEQCKVRSPTPGGCTSPPIFRPSKIPPSVPAKPQAPPAPAPVSAPPAPAPVALKKTAPAPEGPSQGPCSDCGRIIVGPFVNLNDRILHQECFNCSTCGASLKKYRIPQHKQQAHQPSLRHQRLPSLLQHLFRTTETRPGSGDSPLPTTPIASAPHTPGTAAGRRPAQIAHHLDPPAHPHPLQPHEPAPEPQLFGQSRLQGASPRSPSRHNLLCFRPSWSRPLQRSQTSQVTQVVQRTTQVSQSTQQVSQSSQSQYSLDYKQVIGGQSTRGVGGGNDGFLHQTTLTRVSQQMCFPQMSLIFDAKAVQLLCMDHLYPKLHVNMFLEVILC